MCRGGLVEEGESSDMINESAIAKNECTIYLHESATTINESTRIFNKSATKKWIRHEINGGIRFLGAWFIFFDDEFIFVNDGFIYVSWQTRRNC